MRYVPLLLCLTSIPLVIALFMFVPLAEAYHKEGFGPGTKGRRYLVIMLALFVVALAFLIPAMWILFHR